MNPDFFSIGGGLPSEKGDLASPTYLPWEVSRGSTDMTKLEGYHSEVSLVPMH